METRSLSDIRSIRDLGGDGALDRVFASHLGRKVSLANGGAGAEELFRPLDGCNDFYNSIIVTAHLEFNEEDEEVRGYGDVARMQTCTSSAARFASTSSSRIRRFEIAQDGG